MGSGGSSRKSAPAKYQQEPEVAPPDEREMRNTQSQGSVASGADCVSNVRQCDRCGETRKTANFDDTQWLCAACQLASGARPTPKRIQLNDSAPQPMLERGSTQNLDGSHEQKERAAREARRLRRNNTTMSLVAEDPPTVSSSSAAGAEMSEGKKSPKKSRRGGKDRATAKPHEEGGKPALKRAQTVALEVKLSPRNDYRSSEGMTALKQQMGVSVPSKGSSSLHFDDPGSPKTTPVELPPAPKKKLALGYSQGDAVQSLISRLRNGARVLDTGNDGNVVGMAVPSGDSKSQEDIRILVQFRSGIDWYLHPSQICQSSMYPSAKASGLPGGFMWGSRVQILVTYLNPLGAPKAIVLGYAGTVVGPGQVRGKLGVRFDNESGEWSVWPNMLCSAEKYQTEVAALLPGGFQRGDRVMSGGKRTGIRSGSNMAKGTPTVENGDEGTVVGPGHAGGTVLVHFDSDERVWSLLPSQVALSSGDENV